MGNPISNLIRNITQYIEIKTEQLKLRIVARLAKVFSGVFSLFLFLLLGSFFAFFLSFALAHIINESLTSTYAGFLIVSGLYLLLIILAIVLMKKRIIQGWIEIILLQIAENDDDEQDHEV